MEQLECRENISREGLEVIWYSRLLKDYPDLNREKRQSIVRWLIGESLDCFDNLTPRQIAIAEQMMDYRYRILQQRYLELEQQQAYCNLIERLGLLVMLCPKIRTWVSVEQKRQKIVVNLIREAVEEILKGDRSMQQQMVWIEKCTQDSGLRNALLFSSLEEYCAQPIRHKPLLAVRIVAFFGQSVEILPCNVST